VPFPSDPLDDLGWLGWGSVAMLLS